MTEYEQADQVDGEADEAHDEQQVRVVDFFLFDQALDCLDHNSCSIVFRELKIVLISFSGFIKINYLLNFGGVNRTDEKESILIEYSDKKSTKRQYQKPIDDRMEIAEISL